MFPPNKRYREIAIAIRDRSFNCDGSLFYPEPAPCSTSSKARTSPTPTSPRSAIPNSSATRSSSTATRGHADRRERRYRFRVLNGCDSRFLILDFNHIDGVKLWAIGNEGGFLAAPSTTSIRTAAGSSSDRRNGPI